MPSKKVLSKSRVIVISDSQDAHLPFVEPHLDAPFIVIDPREFASGKELTYRFEAGKTLVSYDGMNLHDISGVWYRKPQPITLDELSVKVGADFEEYSKTAMQRHVNLMLTAFNDAVWVSDYFALIRANNKSLQIAVAQQLGMNVPETVMTSDKDVAEKFIKSHARSITKPLTISYPVVNGKHKVFFTTLLEKGFIPDLSQLHLAPAIFQRAIGIVDDVRVIVVGDKVFAATVHAEGVPTNTKVYDYRLGHYEGKVVLEALHDFPEELARQCVAHNKALGLRFGALDFVRDKDGIFWFLENNPNGQWAFVENATGQPIGKAMASLLQGDSQ
ncbi:MAG: hypothetical protein ABWX94_02240 [Candidatus Saccharimonadales bacterium]